MVLFVSPFDDTLVRFDAAASLLARNEPFATAEALLEMLVRATWRGDFNPPGLDTDPDFEGSIFNSPEDWLHIPIEAPRTRLTQGQIALRPRPFEFFESSSHTLLSVMYRMQLLPGDPLAWDNLLDNSSGKLYLHGKKYALAALGQMPLHTYSDAARAYLGSIFVPRRTLQFWLDRRSSRFSGLFYLEQTTDNQLVSHPANGDLDQSPPGRRGRPAFAAWPAITLWALQTNAQFPDMPRKELAGRLYERALRDFHAAAVPNESTILRRLASILSGKTT
jgi:hypothetical protein